MRAPAWSPCTRPPSRCGVRCWSACHWRARRPRRLVMWLVLGRALARLDRIRAEVDAIGPDQLDRRVPDDGPQGRGRAAGGDHEPDAGPGRRARPSGSGDWWPMSRTTCRGRWPRSESRWSSRWPPGRPSTPSCCGPTCWVPPARWSGWSTTCWCLPRQTRARPRPTSAVDLDAIVLEEAARARQSATTVIDTARVSAGPVRGQPQRAAPRRAQPARQRRRPRQLPGRARASTATTGRSCSTWLTTGPEYRRKSVS